MLRVGDNSPLGRGTASASTAQDALPAAASPRTLPASPAPASGSKDAFLGSGFSRYDLLALNAGVDEASRKINALSTANDAIGVIGGLLNNIQGSLAASTDSAADPQAEQSRVDGAIVTVDAIAGSTRFGGRNLLDGSFTLTSSHGSVAIPSFRSSSLGVAVESDASEPSLDSLRSNGVNALALGNHTHATRIVTAALSQVAGTQTQIKRLVSAMASDRGVLLSTDVSAPSPANCPLGADPAAASQATANSSAQRVLALLAF